MAVYKDKKLGTWYVSVWYRDWTNKRKRNVKRGFEGKKDAQDWEMHFLLTKSGDLDMTFGDFWKVYENDIKPTDIIQWQNELHTTVILRLHIKVSSRIK